MPWVARGCLYLSFYNDSLVTKIHTLNTRTRIYFELIVEQNGGRRSGRKLSHTTANRWHTVLYTEEELGVRRRRRRRRTARLRDTACASPNEREPTWGGGRKRIHCIHPSGGNKKPIKLINLFRAFYSSQSLNDNKIAHEP